MVQASPPLQMLPIALTLSAMFLSARAGAEETPSLEARVLAAIADNRPKLLAALVEERDRLKVEERNKLPFRVYGEAIELRFQGQYGSESLMPEMLEYLLATKEKDYEALVVVEEAEIARLAPLKKLLDARKEAAPAFRFQFAWNEAGVARVEDIRDVVQLANCKDQQYFLKQLEVMPAGLGGSMNIEADPTRLPKASAKVTAILTIELPPAFREALK